MNVHHILGFLGLCFIIFMLLFNVFYPSINHSNPSKDKHNQPTLKIDKEKSIGLINSIIEDLGFKLTMPNYLDFIKIDRNPHDMALTFILPAIANDYYNSNVVKGKPFASIFIMAAIKSYLDLGFINNNAFQLAKSVIDQVTADQLYDESLLKDLRRYNYLIPEDLNSPRICDINLDNSENYSQVANMLEQKYHEYLASQ